MASAHFAPAKSCDCTAHSARTMSAVSRCRDSPARNWRWSLASAIRRETLVLVTFRRRFCRGVQLDTSG
jgi:hypothetical protein